MLVYNYILKITVKIIERDKMNITKEKLQELYNSNTSIDTATILGVGVVTLRKYLREAGIPLKGKGNRVNHYKAMKII